MAEERKTRKSVGKKTTDYDFMLEIAGNNELDLREYTEKVKDELKSLEDYCITDYIAVNKDVAILYDELGKSNDILDRIEGIVTKFQTKLGQIADDVSKLQEKSNKYTIALNNRRELEKELSDFLDGILLSPQLVKDLIQNEIDLNYLENLAEFNKILANVAEASKSAPDSQAIKDVIEEIEKLTIQVCYKIRSFLLAKFYSLHKDKTNFQIVQQNMLIRYKSLNAFLRSHSQDKYVEITNQYADYMSKRYYNDLREYSAEVAKLVKEKISKNDVVIIDEYKYKTSVDKMGLSQFGLEEREEILSKIDAEPIVPYHKSKGNDKISLEEAFRSQNKLLINLITTEYTFVLEFFDLKASQCDFIFNTIFSNIVNLYLDWLTTASEYSFDVVSLLMIVLIKSEFKAVMKERKIYILDYYFDKIEMEIWPRFTKVFDHFLANIKNAKPKNFKLYNLSVHFTSQRYVSLVLMLYKIASKTGHNMLLSRLSQMQSLFLSFIEKLADGNFVRAQDKKSKLFFLVNNIHYIYKSINDLHLDIELKDLEKLQEKYSLEVNSFISNTLNDQYSNMIAIVSEFGPAGDSDSSSGDEEGKEHGEHHIHASALKSVDKKKIEMIAQEFNMAYRDKIDSVMKTVKDNAYSEKIAKQILSKFMRTLILKYSTFLEIVKISHPSFFKENMSSHHILLELKNISIDVAKD